MIKFKIIFSLYFFFNATILAHPILSQNKQDSSKIVYKDFYQIDLEDLNNEGPVGELLMKGHTAAMVDSTLFYVQKAMSLSIKNRDSLLKPYILYHLGYTNFNLQKFKIAKKYLNSCLEISKPYSLKGMLYESYNLLGVIEKYNSNFDESISCFQKAIEETSLLVDKMRIKINIASIYIDTNKYEFAKLLIDEVLQFEKDNPGLIGHYWLTFAYINSSYLQISYEEEVTMIEKAVYQAAQSEDAILYVQTKYELASILLSNNKTAKGLIMMSNVIREAKANKMHDIINRAYISKAKAYSNQGNFNASLKVLDSIQLTDDVISQKKDIYQLKYINYKNTNNFKKAVIYSDSIIKYLTEIYTIKKQEATIEYGKKYQTEKKIQENELLKKENKIKELEVDKHRTTRNYLIVLSVLGFITLGVTYSRFRVKRKTAKTLEKQNAVISSQKVALEKSNANKQRLFGIIAHDLVNPFNAILGYTNLLEDDYDSFNEQERKAFIKTINKYATSNYKLTRTLLDWAKLQQDRLVVHKSKLNCSKVVQEAIQPYQVLADKKEIQINTNIPENTFIVADKNMMQIVIGNLFVNAIKFTPQQGEINFYLKKNNDGTINFEIEDNGIGMTQEQLNNLFDITKVNTRKGTHNEKGNGLGLILCKELIELQKGTLQMFSQLHKGSRAVVTI